MRIAMAFAAVLASTAAGSVPASACTCADQNETGGKPLMASRLGRAGIVARGTFIGMRAGEGVELVHRETADKSSNVSSRTVFSGQQAMGEFKVKQAIKGDVSGTVQVFSGLGMGDCGAGVIFLGAIAIGADLSVELKPLSTKPVSYAMDTCGYMETHRREE